MTIPELEDAFSKAVIAQSEAAKQRREAISTEQFRAACRVQDSAARHARDLAFAISACRIYGKT